MRRLGFVLLLALPCGTMAAPPPSGLPVVPLSESSQLTQALVRGDLDKVLALARRLSASDLVDAAGQAAERGEVPAMWVMGQARYLQGNAGETAHWMYRALLGTRLDLALCRDTGARGVVGLWVNGLREAVVASRNDVQIRSQAIRDAVAHYQQFPEDLHPGWTCRWAMAQRLIRPTMAPKLLVDSRQWPEVRRDAFMRFRHEVGLNDPVDEGIGVSFSAPGYR